MASVEFGEPTHLSEIVQNAEKQRKSIGFKSIEERSRVYFVTEDQLSGPLLPEEHYLLRICKDYGTEENPIVLTLECTKLSADIIAQLLIEEQIFFTQDTLTDVFDLECISRFLGLSQELCPWLNAEDDHKSTMEILSSSDSNYRSRWRTNFRVSNNQTRPNNNVVTEDMFPYICDDCVILRLPNLKFATIHNWKILLSLPSNLTLSDTQITVILGLESNIGEYVHLAKLHFVHCKCPEKLFIRLTGKDGTEYFEIHTVDSENFTESSVQGLPMCQIAVPHDLQFVKPVVMISCGILVPSHVAASTYLHTAYDNLRVEWWKQFLTFADQIYFTLLNKQIK